MLAKMILQLGAVRVPERPLPDIGTWEGEDYMQDGYHFATAPWLIGEPQAVDDAELRRGQIVRIAIEPDPEAEVPQVAAVESADPAPSPVMLRAADRVPEPAVQPDLSEIIEQVFDRLEARQDVMLARIEQAQRDGLARLEQLVVATSAPSPTAAHTQRIDMTLATVAREQAALAEALQSLAAGFEVLTAKVAAPAASQDVLLRDVSDIRAGLTELRLQARMIEMQLFGLGRGAEYSRPVSPDIQVLAS